MITSINKKHTLLTALFIMILSLGCMLLSVRIADADTLIDSGTCGEALTWELTDTGTDTVLTISGTGEMYDYNTDSETSPWYAQRESITSVIVGENVTGIGAHAFDGCVLLSKAELPDSVNAINENSFGSCDSLYIYCSEDSYAEQYAVDNGIPYDLTTGHQPDSTTISVEKEATCTEDGKRTYVCTTCKREVEEAIPASHKWSDDYTVDKAATKDEEGMESIHCSECGTVKEGSSRVIPKLAKESISKATISNIVSKTYTGAAIEQEPMVIINEKTLISGTDYSLSYKNNKNAGKATVIITGIGSYTGTISKTFTISKKKITPAVVLSKTRFTWNNKVQTPAVTVKDGNTKLAKSQYTVTFAKGRKNIGAYSVKVTLKGNYSGTKTATYTINPKGTAISSLKPTFNSVAVNWKKQTAKMPSATIAGYQIQYSTSKDFKSGSKTVSIGGYKNITRTIAGLKAESNYYFRIRTNIKVKGKSYYSEWSAIKAVKTKVAPKLRKDSVSLVVGKTYAQKLIDSNGKEIKATAVTWKSNSPSIASINKSGSISAIRPGTAVMIAKYKGGTFKFTVESKKPFDSATKPVINISESRKKELYLKIDWDDISNADYYETFVSVNGGDYKLYDGQYNDESHQSIYTKAGRTYSVKIRGRYDCEVGNYFKSYYTSFSDPVAATCDNPYFNIDPNDEIIIGVGETKDVIVTSNYAYDALQSINDTEYFKVVSKNSDIELNRENVLISDGSVSFTVKGEKLGTGYIPFGSGKSLCVNVVHPRDEARAIVRDYILKNGKEVTSGSGLVGDYYIEREQTLSTIHRIVISTYVNDDTIIMYDIESKKIQFVLFHNEPDVQEGIDEFSYDTDGKVGYFPLSYWGDIIIDEYRGGLYGDEQGIINCGKTGPTDVTDETELYKVYRRTSEAFQNIDWFLKFKTGIGLRDLGYHSYGIKH